MALVLISHDLAVVSEVAQRVAVMYAGEVIETNRVSDIFAAPYHPYTEALLAEIPQHNAGAAVRLRVSSALSVCHRPLPSRRTKAAGGAWPRALVSSRRGYRMNSNISFSREPDHE